MTAGQGTARAFGAAFEWEPRRSLTLERARDRSRFLHVWRLLCMAVAIGTAGSLVVAIGLSSVGGGFGPSSEIADTDALTIRNPRFTGRDSSGDPFTVTADTAVRRGRDSPLIDLTMPRYEARGGQVATALKGVYDTKARTMLLVGDVTFLDAENRVFRAPSAFLDAKADRISGEGPIVGTGPLGDIRADAYEFNPEGGRIRLRGNVKGQIRGGGSADADPGAQGQSAAPGPITGDEG